MDFRNTRAFGVFLFEAMAPSRDFRRGPLVRGRVPRRRKSYVEVCALGAGVVCLGTLFLHHKLGSHPSEGRSLGDGPGPGPVTASSRSVTREAGYATAAGTAGFAMRHPVHLYRRVDDLTLSTVGMGTYLGNVDAATDELVADALRASIENGVNHLDCASNYRKGRAEMVVGATLKAMFRQGTLRRDEIVVATKAGFIATPDLKRRAVRYGATESEFDTSGRHCVSPACLRASLDMSLERLQLDCVDVLYLHNVAEKRFTDLDEDKILAVIETAFRACEEMRDQGMLRYYGLATFSKAFRVPPGSRGALRLNAVVELAKNAANARGHRDHGFRFVQLPVSVDMPEMFTAKYQDGMTLADAAKLLNVALVSSKSLGVVPKGKKIPRRLACPDVVTLRPFSDDPGAQALQFTRSVPGLTSALVGHKSPDHVRANLALLASHPPLSEDLFHKAVLPCGFPELS